MHLRCASGFSRLCHAFFGWSFISKCGTYQWSSSLGRHLSCLGHFVLMCNSLSFLSHMDTTSFLLFIYFGKFRQESYLSMWGHYGSRIVIIFLGPFNEVLSLTTIILSGISFLSMDDCAPSIFLRNWVLVVMYLCFRFHIFNRPILEEYVFQIEEGKRGGGAHLLQSCLHATWNDLPLEVREMHPFFESLIVIGAPSLHAFFMDFHHDTSFKSILENDSISSTSKTHIHFCSNKGAGLWLVVRPSIHSFRITHSIFTSTLHFHLGLIQPLTFSLLMCECGHILDAFGMHLIHCLFEGQRIATHDAI